MFISWTVNWWRFALSSKTKYFRQNLTSLINLSSRLLFFVCWVHILMSIIMYSFLTRGASVFCTTRRDPGFRGLEGKVCRSCNNFTFKMAYFNKCSIFLHKILHKIEQNLLWTTLSHQTKCFLGKQENVSSFKC